MRQDGKGAGRRGTENDRAAQRHFAGEIAIVLHRLAIDGGDNVALLEACHGWLGGGPVLVTTGCRSETVASGALVPQGCACTIASVGRPPPLSD